MRLSLPFIPGRFLHHGRKTRKTCSFGFMMPPENRAHNKKEKLLHLSEKLLT
jgi:hypothetical protein